MVVGDAHLAKANATALNSELRAPARTEPHAATLVSWPTHRPVWGSQRHVALEEYEGLIHSMARYEPVVVVTDPSTAAEAGERVGAVATLLELPIDDAWVRDNGPIFLVGDDGRVGLTQFGFNGWGEKYQPFDKDADVPRRLAEALGLERFVSRLVMEGGGFSVDGEGTLITTESVVLNPNRNPGWTREECEAALCEATGCTRIIWLAHGLVEDRDTDGHSDNVVQFVAPGRVVAQMAPDRSNPNWEPLSENLARLRQAVDARGRRLEVVEVPWLPYTESIEGHRYAIPYVNFYPVNGAVIAPATGSSFEAAAYELLGELFPGREVVGVASTALAYGGGGVGCVTQQVPDAVSLAPLTSTSSIENDIKGAHD